MSFIPKTIERLLYRHIMVEALLSDNYIEISMGIGQECQEKRLYVVGLQIRIF